MPFRDLRLGDERARAAPAHEVALAHELVERGANGQARHAEVETELPLGGNRIADPELVDQLEHPLAGLALLAHDCAPARAAIGSPTSRAPESGSK